MVRNFHTSNGRRSRPRRSWRKKTGPRESRRTAIATTANSGARRSSPTPAPARSTARLHAYQSGWEGEALSESVDMGRPGEKPAAAEPTHGPPRLRRWRRIIGSDAATASAIGVAAAGLVIWLSFESGGFFPGTTALAILVVLAGLVVFAMVAQGPGAGLRPRLGIAVGALALYALWQLISSSWSHTPGRAALASDLTLLYVLVTIATGLLVTTPARVRALVLGIVAGLVVVCAAGLLTRTLPNVFPIAPG